MFSVDISLQWCFILLMFQCSVLVVFFMLVIIFVSRCGIFLQIDSLSIFGLIIMKCIFFGCVLQSMLRIMVLMLIDLLELVVLVISRCGIFVRLVIIGLLVMFLFNIMVSGDGLLWNLVLLSILCRQMVWCFLFGSLSLIYGLFGIIFIMCMVIVDSDCVRFCDRLEICVVLMSGVRFSLKWVIIGFGEQFIIFVLMWKLVSCVFIRCVICLRVKVFIGLILFGGGVSRFSDGSGVVGFCSG